MSDKAQLFLSRLRKAVETDQLTLPTLPEVALKIRDAVESKDNSAEQIAEILSQDAALSARLLQLANSPLYRARTEIDNLQMAITRLGTRIVRDLVISLALRQIYKASSDSVNQQFRELWATSVEVAAICRLLAISQPGLEPEQALLAGLIHNIGALPIIKLAEDDDELANNRELLIQLTNEIQSAVGEMILTFWNFPEHFIKVVCQWPDFSQQHTGQADYIDVVQVAVLQSKHFSQSNLPSDWSQVPAFDKLGLDSSINMFEDDTAVTSIDETRQTLMAI